MDEGNGTQGAAVFLGLTFIYLLNLRDGQLMLTFTLSEVFSAHFLM